MTEQYEEKKSYQHKDYLVVEMVREKKGGQGSGIDRNKLLCDFKWGEISSQDFGYRVDR